MTLAIITTIACLVGIVLGRHFKVLSLVPAIVVLLVTAIYIGLTEGWLSGLLVFVVPWLALQAGYFGSVIVHGRLRPTEPDGDADS